MRLPSVVTQDSIVELDRLVRDQVFCEELLSSSGTGDTQLVSDALQVVILFHRSRRGLECPGYKLALESLYYQMLKHGFVEPERDKQEPGSQPRAATPG